MSRALEYRQNESKEADTVDELTSIMDRKANQDHSLMSGGIGVSVLHDLKFQYMHIRYKTP